MGNFSVYFNDIEKEKIVQVANECDVQKSTPIKVLVEYVPKQFLLELVQNWKERQ